MEIIPWNFYGKRLFRDNSTRENMKTPWRLHRILCGMLHEISMGHDGSPWQFSCLFAHMELSWKKFSMETVGLYYVKYSIKFPWKTLSMVFLCGQKHMKTSWRPAAFHGNFMEHKIGTSKMLDRRNFNTGRIDIFKKSADACTMHQA